MARVSFQNCMHGGRRPKWSTWATNVSELKVLGSASDGKHSHLPWGVAKVGRTWSFATEKEAEYPELLCSRVAEQIADRGRKRGHKIIKAPLSKKGGTDESTPRNAKLQAQSGKQPRGAKYPEVIPEFKETVEISLSRAEWEALKLK